MILVLTSLSGPLLLAPRGTRRVHLGTPGPPLSPLFLLPSAWPEPQGEGLS